MSYHQQLLELAIEWEIKAGKLMEEADGYKLQYDTEQENYERGALNGVIVCQTKAKELMTAAKILRQEIKGEN